VRVVREGVVADELLRMFFRNSRFPEMKGDTSASMAAIRLASAPRRVPALRLRRHDWRLDRLIDESEAELPAAARARARGVRLHDTIEATGRGPSAVTAWGGPAHHGTDTGASDDGCRTRQLLMSPRM
jgi:N-methylhydantoinase B/oxoprolinase/acetone carboxylase alpha subunit